MASRGLNVDGLCLLTCSPVSLHTRHDSQQLVQVFLYLPYKVTPLLNKRIGYSHRPVQTAYRYCVPRRIAGLLFSFVWADSLCMRMKEIKESRVHQPCAARAKKGHTKQAGRLWAHCKENRGTIIHWRTSPPSCCSFLAPWLPG